MTSKVLLVLVTTLLFGEGAAVRGSLRKLKKGNPDTEDGVAPAFLSNAFGGFGGGGGGGGGKKPDSIIPDFGEQTENAGDKAEDIINNVINFGNNGDRDEDEDDEDEDNGNNNVPGMYTYFIDERHFGFQDLFLDSDTFTVTNSREEEVYSVTGMFTELQEIGLEQLLVQDSTTEEDLFVINQEVIRGFRNEGTTYSIVPQTTNTQSRNTVSYEVVERSSTVNSLMQSLVGVGETQFDINRLITTNTANGERTRTTRIFTTKGDFWGSDFRITQPGGRSAMATLESQSQGPQNWGDYYQLNVVRGQDPGLMLSICIVIDQMLFDGRGE